MNRTTEHDLFVIEREYPNAAPERVFAAWADPQAKRQWFGAPEQPYELDFREGGTESTSGGPPDGPVFTYFARYMDIVDGERIVYAYDLLMGDQRLSVSVVTVEFTSAATSGCKLRYTEQVAMFDGLDQVAERHHGTEGILDRLTEHVA